ncbi:hypothetical protein V1514DRAFT_292532 [Lipomyces japonicus]|uniref:uncharacterized protein n=1 Tax=Lipomyces japonicus TaxID=56871 RepID=UPI0034CE488E
MFSSIADLPNETLLIIFSYLGSHCFLNTSQVCKRWRQLTRIGHVLASHIKSHILEPGREDGFLDLLANEHSDYNIYNFYQYLLRQKSIGLEFFLKYHIDGSEWLRRHPHFECSTHSNDGKTYVVMYRDPRTLPFPVRTIRVYQFKLERLRLAYSFVLATSTDRRATKVVLSRDCQSLAIAYQIGYVEVYKLSALDDEPQIKSHFPTPDPPELTCVFAKQYPSSIHSLAISCKAEMLVLGSQRLGGLLAIDLKTGTELDLPHYRLDLEVALEAQDRALLLRGWHETIVIRSLAVDDDDEGDRESVWEYFHALIMIHESCYVPLEKAVAVQGGQYFVGIRTVDGTGGQGAGGRHQLKLVYDQADGDFRWPNKEIETDDNDDEELGNDDSVGKVLVDLPNSNPNMYRFIISESTSKMLVAWQHSVRLISLNDEWMKALTKHGITDPPATDKTFENCRQKIIEKELEQSQAPCLSRKFPFNLWTQHIEDIWFIEEDAVVVEYSDNICVFKISNQPERAKCMMFNNIGEVVDA